MRRVKARRNGTCPKGSKHVRHRKGCYKVRHR